MTHRTFRHHLYDKMITNLTIGDHFVCTNGDRILSTLLGSCVSACVRDPIKRISGMNHFLLPKPSSTGINMSCYGHHAMELLINDMLKAGANKNDLIFKVFGGSNVVSHITNDIGLKNIEFVKNWIQSEGYKLEAIDVGGSKARKIYFDTETGKVSRQFINGDRTHIFDQEKKVNVKQEYGDVELFNQ